MVVNEFFNFGGLVNFLQLLNARVGGIFLFGYKESVMGFSPAGSA